MTEREALWCYVGIVAGLLAMYFIVPRGGNVSFTPFACQAHESHLQWHATEDAFKLGQKNTDATSTAEVVARHGR